MTPERCKEIIATFMEPNPVSRTRSRDSEGGWWRLIGADRATAEWEVAFFDCWTLDRLREVEARLTDEQWWSYEKFVRDIPYDQFIDNSIRCALHASAEAKIVALAAVIGTNP